MSMKHLLTLALVSVCWSAQAQFVGTRSLFLMSNLLDNPAAAGNSPCLDMRMGVRSQWTGFEGAPLTSFASLSGRLGQGTTLAHGMGGYVMTDAIGPWSNTRFSLAYSTKIRLTTGARLSAGIGLGMVQYRLDVGSLQFPEVAATDDPALSGSATAQTVFPTMDFGLWYEDKLNFAAFSIQNVTATTLADIAATTSSGRTAVLTGDGTSNWTGGLPSAPRFKCEWLLDCLRPSIFRAHSAWTTAFRWVWATVQAPHWSGS